MSELDDNLGILWMEVIIFSLDNTVNIINRVKTREDYKIDSKSFSFY